MVSLPSSPDFEAVVIGGGPAGSAAASWLSRQGRRVALFERERHPRFHIGESLLPNANNVLKQIGAWEKIEAAGFIEKRGAEFTLPNRSQRILNLFANGLVPGMERTFQVERARFDEILFYHARSCGCQAEEGQAVVGAQRSHGLWQLEVEDVAAKTRRAVQAEWIIDASGRSCLMGRYLKLPKEQLPYPGRIAIFNHFRNLPRDPGERGGDIIVMRLPDAWFWAIPISAETTSVGVVAQKGAGPRPGESREAFFWRKVSQSSWLTKAMQQAQPLGEFRQESDYSFSYSIFGRDNALLAGDAASFIDPVFSSGVYLALESGLLAAKIVSQRLVAGKPGDRRLYAQYTREVRERVGTMRKLIDAYYHNASFEVFMTPKPPMGLDRAVNSVLAGCLNPPFSVRWRFLVFRLICRLHRHFSLVPKLNW